MKALKILVIAFLLTSYFQTVRAQFDDVINKGNVNTVTSGINNKPIDQTKSQPCWLGDTKDYFAASGRIVIHTGGPNKSNYTDEINKLLNTLRQQVKQKIGGRYTAIMRDYFDQLDVDDNSTMASHIESAGEEAIDAYLNETQEVCRQLTDPDDNDSGDQYVYIGITVSKEKLAEAMVNAVKESKNIPDDVRDKVRQNEDKFRKSTIGHFNETGE